MAASLVCNIQAEQFSLLNYYPGYYWSQTNWTSNTLNFPYRGGSFPAFVLKTNSQPQDISKGGAISATFRIIATEDTSFTFGGEGRWNTGTMPPHIRLFFSSYHGYLNENACYSCSWWSADGWTKVTNGVFTISASLDPTRWTHSSGQTNAEAFNSTLTNAIEYGVSFGGGSFYDIGVGVTNGSATFELLSLDLLSLNSDVSLSISNGLSDIYTSTTLTNWYLVTTRVGPTNVYFTVECDEPHKFWKAIAQ